MDQLEERAPLRGVWCGVRSERELARAGDALAPPARDASGKGEDAKEGGSPPLAPRRARARGAREGGRACRAKPVGLVQRPGGIKRGEAAERPLLSPRARAQLGELRGGRLERVGVAMKKPRALLGGWSVRGYGVKGARGV